jgi:hypothetical protein
LCLGTGPNCPSSGASGYCPAAIPAALTCPALTFHDKGVRRFAAYPHASLLLGHPTAAQNRSKTRRSLSHLGEFFWQQARYGRGRFFIQMGENLIDDHRVLNAGDHVDAAACWAHFDVNIKNPLASIE